MAQNQYQLGKLLLLSDLLCWKKTRGEQGEIEDCYWTAFVWCRGGPGFTSSAESLIRTEQPIHSLRGTNQTTLGQYFPFLFLHILRSEKRKVFSSFFSFTVLSDHRQVYLEPQRHNYRSSVPPQPSAPPPPPSATSQTSQSVLEAHNSPVTSSKNKKLQRALTDLLRLQFRPS